MPPETSTAARSSTTSRGKVTITLTNPKEAKDEKAKVTVTLNEPEKMVERVVHQLARKFPPESVMTIDARAGDCSSQSTTAPTTVRKDFRLIQEEIPGGVTTLRTIQSYFISDELDVAIPILPSDVEVCLSSGSTMHIDPSNVTTCIYGANGFIESCLRGYYNEHALNHNSAKVPVPQKPGIGHFVQHVVINSDVFSRCIPTCPGQSLIHLTDGDLYSIDHASDVYAIFFSEKGLARFTAGRSACGREGPFIGQLLHPGIPNASNCPTAVVCGRVLSDDEAVPIALSAASRAIASLGQSSRVSLYDECGAFIAQRTSTGGILPPQKLTPPAARLRYVWIPAARLSRQQRPAQVIRIAPLCQPSLLADGRHADPCLPKDIDVLLLDSSGHEIGAFVADRKPSLVIGNADDVGAYIPPYVAADAKPTRRQEAPQSEEDILSSHGSEVSSIEPLRHERAQHRRNPAKVFKSDDTYDDVYTSKTQSSARSAPSSRHRRSNEPATLTKKRPVPRKEVASCGSSSSSTDEDDSAPGAVSRRQAYYKPAEIDYAIPLAPGQTQVKLINGERLKVDVARTFVVAYDMKGFPLFTIYPDGRRHRWAAHESGVGIHVQDYFMDQELLYAVPITPTQSEVLVNDGSVITVKDESVVTVFYDSSGRPAFNYGLPKSGGRRRIRPGTVQNPGIAASVQYVWLIDCKDGTDEQFVVPIKGHQKKIQDPLSKMGLLNIDRDKLTTLFYDDDKTPIYTKLHDGTLVSNGLQAVDHSSSEHESYQRVYNNTSEDMTIAGGDIMSIRRSAVEPPSCSNVSSACTKVIQRQVPVQKIEYRDKIVEVPEVHVVEKHVEVEKVEYVTKFVKKKQIVERPVEHVKYVPKIETKIVERVIEIPKVIEVERPEIIEQKISVDNFIDTKKEVVVANKLIPQIVDMPDFEETIECLRLEPELVAVDVYVPKLVRGKLRGLGLGKEERRPVDISLGHFNSLVLKLNQHLGENYERLPLMKISEGTYPMLNRDAKISVHQPTDQEILQFLQQTGLISNEQE